MTDKKKYDYKKVMKSLSKNYWAIATVILAALLLTILLTKGDCGSTISTNVVRDNVLSFIENQGGEIELGEIIDEGSFYQVMVEGEQGGSIFVTKDGNFVIQPQVELTGQVTAPTQEEQAPEPTEIPKSDKPLLEAVVTPYCPYGLQYMKGLLPVYELMKDKADISILSLGITHMQNEQLETQRQICIQEEYNKDKLFDYLNELIYNEISEKCYADYHSDSSSQKVENFDVCMAPAISSIMGRLDIDENKINTCMSAQGEELYNEAVSYSRSKGAGGSPSPFLNGVQLLAGRSPEAIKTALCDSFNEAPEECSTILSSETPAPGITSQASGSNTQAQC